MASATFVFSARNKLSLPFKVCVLSLQRSPARNTLRRHGELFARELTAMILSVALFIDERGDIQSDSVNLKDKEHARLWAAETPGKRPWRGDFRVAFRQVLQAIKPLPTRVLELGSGPGLLAKCVLKELSVSEYVLFDFSEPMMEMAREVLGARSDVTYHLGHFGEVNWEQKLHGAFDAIISMQAVHEIRHKRHVPWLYSRAATLLRPGGHLVVCDYEPKEGNDPLQHQLASTRREQEHAMKWAGLEDFQVHKFAHQYYLLSAMKI